VLTKLCVLINILKQVQIIKLRLLKAYYDLLKS